MQDLRCPIENHNKKRFVSVHLNDVSDKRFHCFQCQSDTTSKLTQSFLNANELCDLDEVMDNNHYSVFNWPVDPVGKKVKETLQQFKTPEQQKKEIEDFFLQAKQKLNEQLDTIKQLLLEALIVNQPIKDDKNAPKPDEGKDQKKDDKKDSKKDDKKDTKKDDKKDDKKDTKKDDKKDTKKDDKKDSKKEEPVKLEQKEPEKLDLSPTGENLKKFYDQVYDLARIKQIIKEGAKGDSKVMSDKISEYLNDPKRKENFTHLKDIHQRFLANTDKKSELPTGREVTQIFQDQIEKAVQTWIKYFGQVNWKFEQSKAEESNKVKILDNGIEFQGAASQSQIIYSSQAFSQGQHGCIMIFQEFDQSRTTRNGNLFVGLVSEDKKDKKGYGHDYRKCLFTGNGEGLITKIGQDFNAVFKAPPKLLSIKVDVDNELFEVSDGKRSVAYGLDRESKLKNKQWRIYLYWKDASDRVRLIHSY